MNPEQFSQLDQTSASLVVFGIILALTAMWYGAQRLRRTLHNRGTSFTALLQRPVSIWLLHILRYVVAAAGALTLVLTIFPGLFKSWLTVDPNLGLGGIAMFFLWPLIMLQIALGFIAWEKKAAQSPIGVWVFLIFTAFIIANVDIAALKLIYN